VNDADTHGADPDLLGDILGLIGVDLVEVSICAELVRHLLENGRDDSAWTTPSCPKVKDGNTVL
jgi:hypothetical protein